MAVAKASATASVTTAGQVVPYTLAVTNDGNVTLTGITVTDARCDAPGPVYASGDTNTDGKLQLAESWTYTCGHTVTQAEVDAGGSLSNTATADSTESPETTDTLDIPVARTPSMSVAKTATAGFPYSAVGDVISYSYVVTSTGNVTLTGPVTVSDDKTSVTCPDTASLRPRCVHHLHLHLRCRAGGHRRGCRDQHRGRDRELRR